MNWLQFETDTLCSGRCAICPKGRGMVPHREPMQWDTVARLVADVVPQAGWVYPFLYQEPTEEPRLPQILHLIKTVNPKAGTAISTTMTWMTRELQDTLIRTGDLDVMAISFYAPDPDTLAQYQPGLDFGDTERRIRRFMEARKAAGADRPRVTMHYITTTDLTQRRRAFWDRWQGIPDTIGWVHFDDFRGAITGFREDTKAWTAQNKMRTPCSRLWDGMTVLSSGAVVPCCLDYAGELPLGNVNEEPAMAIWEGQKIRELRALHEAGRMDEIPLCRDCGVWRQERTMINMPGK